MGSTAIELLIMPALSGLGYGTLCGGALLVIFRAIGSMIGQDVDSYSAAAHRPTTAGDSSFRNRDGGLVGDGWAPISVTRSYVITTQTAPQRRA